MKNSIKQELTEHSVEMLLEMVSYENECYGCDIHNKLFNEDHYLIGYYNCEQWIKTHNLNVFDIIREVKDYETERFGELFTDVSNSEKLVNMYVFILGDEILNNTKHIHEVWDEECTTKDYNKIIKELS